MDEGKEEGYRLGRRGFGKAVGGTLLGAGALSRAGVDRASAQEDGIASGPTVYVGSWDDTLYAVDAESGEQEWAFTEPSGSVRSSPTVVDGTVYVGSFDDTLYAVDALLGTQEWAFTEPSGTVSSSPTVVDGTVYVGSAFPDNTLYAVDASTGEQEWAFTEPSDLVSTGSVVSSPTVVDGTVYVGSWDDTLYAVDAESGEQEWAFTEPSDDVNSSPTVVDGTVYVGSWDDTLYAVDASSGTQEWAFTEPSDRVFSSPTVVDGTVYVGSHDNTLYAVDAESGTQEWAFTELSHGVFSSPTVVDGTVYVGSYDDTLYAVDAESGTQEWAFTEPSGSFRSSPTVVADPSDGDSIDSRVLQGTLGHHDDLRAGEMLSMNDLEIDTGDEQTGDGDARDEQTEDDGAGDEQTGDGGTGDGETGGDNTGATETDDTATDPDGMPMTVIAGGAVGLLSVVYGGYRLLGSGKSEEETEEPTEPHTTETQKTTTDRRTTETEVDIDEKLRGVRSRIDQARTALSSANFETALSHAERATDEAKEARRPAKRVNRTDEVEELFQEARDIRDEVSEEKETYEEMESEIGKARRKLDRAEDRVEDAPETALDRVKETADMLDGIEREAEEYVYEINLTEIGDDVDKAEVLKWMVREGDVVHKNDPIVEVETDRSIIEIPSLVSGRVSKIHAREGETVRVGATIVTLDTNEDLRKQVEDLKQRCEALRKRAEKEIQASKNEDTRSPETPPSVPNLSIEYTEIEDREPIGVGGNADVYKVEYEGETIAIKEPRMDGTLHMEAAERFMVEAETWDKLDDHENIVSVIDYGSEPLPWIAMEYMDGGELSERTDDMPLEEKLWVASEIADAVWYAHSRGVAHLDLKPENILFRKTDEGYDVPKVADWGLAKMLLEHSKSVEGLSIQYSAPEQFDEERFGEPDSQTDIYQLGAVLYDAFTGRPPFEGGTSQVMYSVVNEEVERPTSVNPELPEELDEILLEALEKDREDRYETMVYLRDDLRKLL